MNQLQHIPPRLVRLAETIKDNGGELLLVGGCVRDYLMKRAPKDFDAEVYGIEQSRLFEILKSFGRVSSVGESFTVYKLGKDLDVSLPRRERKQGRGHKAFVVEGDHTMTFEEAARRRDFTINAMLQNPLSGEIIDPFDGQNDLQKRLLRAVNNETFVEDSLRVLRAAQFAARFDFTIEPATIELCRTVDVRDLPPERVWGEIEKLLLHAAKPSVGLHWLENLNATKQLFPSLALLSDKAKTETYFAIDRARTLIEDLPHAKQVAVMLAVWCLRLSLTDALTVLEQLKIHTFDGYDVRRQTLALVREQAKPFEFYESQIKNGVFRRLAASCELDLLWRVAVAQSENQSQLQACEAFIQRARKLKIEHRAPAPLLQGRHLQAIGLQPSPQFGVILKQIYELQMDDLVTTLAEAEAAAKNIIATAADKSVVHARGKE